MKRWQFGAALGLLAPEAALADVVTYSGELFSTRAAFDTDTMGLAGLEDFETFIHGQTIGDMPGNAARFAPEYADGSPALLPIILNQTGAPSGYHWVVNFGYGRPAWSAWVIRPDDPADSIYAFGQAGSFGDWVRVEGFDSGGNLVVSVESPALTGGAFAGFAGDVPMARVVVTPLGDSDGLNGMDDVQVSVAPIPTPATLACVMAACAGVPLRRRR